MISHRDCLHAFIGGSTFPNLASMVYFLPFIIILLLHLKCWRGNNTETIWVSSCSNNNRLERHPYSTLFSKNQEWDKKKNQEDKGTHVKTPKNDHERKLKQH